MNAISIGVVSRETGVKVPTIRYYESVGLLPSPERTDSNRRSYDDATVRRLRFIRHARELGFEVDAIRQLLDLSDQPERSCAEVDVIARSHLAEIDEKIARLTALRFEVQRMVDEGEHGRVAQCRVIEVLGDHAACLHERH
ncbi:helix-turn-helix domain-containing protein [Kaistia dalseonensis]|uniref:DNA-binding transcriptional MerR regulator n=1 Tax=Kaistia dalseonensis TaxID=410840 RepID=A0ABU0HCX2_9HYPH|nr:helix-turn-helix domain-containing protein [Kaistia dalseonensis]MCX5497526.1 helix-turn-helix domain-containing protein [Kaistia dalseonensis]MDQ0440165.1 DNA-binding transcriptional MerR regulator [Kaistia dalseonensis]